MSSGPPRKRIRQIAGQSALSFRRSDETGKRRKHEGITIYDCFCLTLVRLCVIHSHHITSHRVLEYRWKPLSNNDLARHLVRL